MLNILLVDDEPDLRSSLGQVLRDEGHVVDMASDGEAAIARLAAQPFHLVVSDVRLPKLDGAHAPPAHSARLPVDRGAAHDGLRSIGDAVTAMKDSAVDYLTKPFDIEPASDRRRAHRGASSARRDERGARAHRVQTGAPPPRRAGAPADPAARREDRRLARYARGGAPHRRERHGQGARRAHAPRAQRRARRGRSSSSTARPFRRHAHRGGALRPRARRVHGRVERRDGRFEAADGGTLFLDEIGELPLEAQAEAAPRPPGRRGRARRRRRRRRRSTCASSRRRTATSRRSWPRAASARTSTTASRSSTCACRRCASAEGDLALLVEHFLRELSRGRASAPGLSAAAWAALSGVRVPRQRARAAPRDPARVDPRARRGDRARAPAAGDRGPRRRGRRATARPLTPSSRRWSSTRRSSSCARSGATGERRQRAAKLLGISRKSLWKKLTQVRPADPSIERRQRRRRGGRGRGRRD